MTSLHPDSQLDLDDSEFEEEEEIEFESIDADAEVVLDSLDSDELAEFDPDMNGGEIGPNTLSDDELDDVADSEDVSLVEADLTIELADDVDSETAEFFEEFFEEEPVYFITATHDGDWLILDETQVTFGFGDF